MVEVEEDFNDGFMIDLQSFQEMAIKRQSNDIVVIRLEGNSRSRSCYGITFA